MPKLYEQLLQLAACVAEHGTAPCFNPHPAGCPVPQSGTDKVLNLLRAVYPYSLPHAEIRRRTGLSRGCVAWALRYLEQIQQIEVVRHDNNRGPGYYQRYKALNHGHQHEHR